MSDSQQQEEDNSSSSSYSLPSKTDLALWLTRLLTVVFTFFYLIGISGQSSYQRALLASAATSALRLHQRLPPFRLTRDYLALVLLEDSAHYLLYALLFATSSLVSLSLLPIALFALLHWSSMTLNLIPRDNGLSRILSSVVQQYQRSILQTVALTEIMLMPTLVVCLFSSVVSLLTPFVYFRFLALRYSSRRNPYTRQMMHELRLSTEHVLSHQYCPLLARRAGHAIIALISRLA